MFDNTRSVCHVTDADAYTTARLNWYAAELAREDKRRELFRTRFEEEEALSMRRPVATREAFALLGTLLGLLPPAAMFWRFWGDRFLKDLDGNAWLLAMCVAMNVVCCFVGRRIGAELGRGADALERRSWPLMLLVSAILGLLWALVTGAAGGAVFFIIGASVGAVCAAPVGLLAFPVFTSLHRLVARGGMIDERRLRPLAFGVTGVIAALILSPSVFPN
ncbi:MAG TPA: hypothetical protein VM934_00965 [Pyrinomonadaceae bacterium]|jgi:hypothetical protein|nr:hypothetical protein [Pyrinomonadaceae bacterium]